jgi:hypothetical protein
MIRVLEKFEDKFPDVDDTREGQIFKGDLRNAFNDVIRAQRDELRDYDIDYRPLRLTNDNVLALTQTFMQTVQKIDFDSKPSIKFYANFDSRRVLEALRSELGAGVIVSDQDGLVLEIIGVTSCVDCVLPIMDRYRLHASVNPRYNEWREEVVRLYRS